MLFRSDMCYDMGIRLEHVLDLSLDFRKFLWHEHSNMYYLDPICVMIWVSDYSMYYISLSLFQKTLVVWTLKFVLSRSVMCYDMSIILEHVLDLSLSQFQKTLVVWTLEYVLFRYDMSIRLEYVLDLSLYFRYLWWYEH